jgi:hypothetical protein
MLHKLIVTVVGLLLILWVNWYFLFSEPGTTRKD